MFSRIRRLAKIASPENTNFAIIRTPLGFFTIEMSLKDAELTPAAIDQNVLVGGSTRIPAVQKIVE